MIKVLATKPDDQSSVPGTHTVKGESGLPKGVLWPPDMHHGTHTTTHAHK